MSKSVEKGHDMKVLLGITGGIAAYKAGDIISGLKATGNEVHVIMTDAAQKFICRLVLSTLSGNPVMTNLWSERGSVEHIEVAKWCDVMAIAPATMNTICKVTNGIADNLLTTVFAAIPKGIPRLIFPAINTVMYESFAMKHALRVLLGVDNIHVYPTVEKRLACGDIGKGALMKPRDIVTEINSFSEKV